LYHKGETMEDKDEKTTVGMDGRMDGWIGMRQEFYSDSGHTIIYMFSKRSFFLLCHITLQRALGEWVDTHAT
ncbi:hypothetical protein OFB79_26590, partial [Escherichia coli]|nr:hypothetical protein [Escherichia coli]